jgi:hypothetical protein
MLNNHINFEDRRKYIKIFEKHIKEFLFYLALYLGTNR